MLSFLFLSCSSPKLIQIIYEDSNLGSSLQSFVGTMSVSNVVLSSIDEPVEPNSIQINVFSDGAKKESYTMGGTGTQLEIHGGDILGVQYGLAHALEIQGFRFYHPYEILVPDELAPFVDSEDFGVLHEPEMARRGIHLHILHPIEGYYDFWELDDAKRAEQVGSWVIKNRGDYLQWVGLDDISENPIRMEEWKSKSADVVENLHKQGLEVGIGVQIYGSGNLQNAYDLIDNTGGDIQGQITERLSAILSAADFDLLEISFGEFFGEDPQTFIDSLDTVHTVAKSIDPDIETGARIHVGADLLVEYDGVEQIYYFLAQYANEEIVPWVHTVMYYNLFDPANGAYHHEDFADHRDFLFSRLRDGLPVVYFPESAYWVAFDNSVPQFLPLYIYSRWKDIVEIAGRVQQEGTNPLQEHVLFSSGWEWGYWQNDVATLRMNWKLEQSYETILADMFAPFSEYGVAQVVARVASIQKEFLIDRQLDRYICGVDVIMEIGYGTGIVSQPPRPSFLQISQMDSTVVLEIVDQLRLFAQQQKEQGEALAGIDDSWVAEIHDGISINVLRANYMALLMENVAQENPDFSEAEDLLVRAKIIVDNRADHAHDPNMKRLTSEDDNATIYQFGYLYRAHELCYWERERIQAQNVILDTSQPPPGCGI